MTLLNKTLVLAIILLAGCAGQDAPSSPSTSQTSTVADVGPTNAPPPLNYTDILHFLAPPKVTIEAPTDEQSTSIALHSVVTEASTTRPTWAVDELPPDATFLEGTATLWVEVAGTVVSNPNGGCFWLLQLTLKTGDQQFGQQACFVEPAMPAAGTKVIEIPFNMTLQGPLGKGASLEISMAHGAYATSPDARVSLLIASVTHDSTIEIKGLQRIV